MAWSTWDEDIFGGAPAPPRTITPTIISLEEKMRRVEARKAELESQGRFGPRAQAGYDDRKGSIFAEHSGLIGAENRRAHPIQPPNTNWAYSRQEGYGAIPAAQGAARGLPSMAAGAARYAATELDNLGGHRAEIDFDKPQDLPGHLLRLAREQLFPVERSGVAPMSNALREMAAVTDLELNRAIPVTPEEEGSLAYGAGAAASQFVPAVALGTTLGPAGVAPWFGVMGGSSADNINREALAAGADAETALDVGRIGGLAEVGAEMLPVAAAAKRFGGGIAGKVGAERLLAKLPFVKNALASQLGQRAVRGAAGFLEEGGEEAITQGVQNAAAAATYDPDRPFTQGMGDAALVGGMVGGGTSVVAPLSFHEQMMQSLGQPAGVPEPTFGRQPSSGGPVAPTERAAQAKQAAEAAKEAIRARSAQEEPAAPLEAPFPEAGWSAVPDLVPPDAPFQPGGGGQTIEQRNAIVDAEAQALVNGSDRARNVAGWSGPAVPERAPTIGPRIDDEVAVAPRQHVNSPEEVAKRRADMERRRARRPVKGGGYDDLSEIQLDDMGGDSEESEYFDTPESPPVAPPTARQPPPMLAQPVAEASPVVPAESPASGGARLVPLMDPGGRRAIPSWISSGDVSAALDPRTAPFDSFGANPETIGALWNARHEAEERGVEDPSWGLLHEGQGLPFAMQDLMDAVGKNIRDYPRRFRKFYDTVRSWGDERASDAIPAEPPNEPDHGSPAIQEQPEARRVVDEDPPVDYSKESPIGAPTGEPGTRPLSTPHTRPEATPIDYPWETAPGDGLEAGLVGQQFVSVPAEQLLQLAAEDIHSDPRRARFDKVRRAHSFIRHAKRRGKTIATPEATVRDGKVVIEGYHRLQAAYDQGADRIPIRVPAKKLGELRALGLDAQDMDVSARKADTQPEVGEHELVDEAPDEDTRILAGYVGSRPHHAGEGSGVVRPAQPVARPVAGRAGSNERGSGGSGARAGESPLSDAGGVGSELRGGVEAPVRSGGSEARSEAPEVGSAPPKRDTFDDIEQKIAARKQAVSAFRQRHGETPFEAPAPGLAASRNARIIISRDIEEPGKWRYTIVDNDGPSSHSTRDTWEEAVAEAVTDYHMDLGNVTMPKKPRPVFRGPTPFTPPKGFEPPRFDPDAPPVAATKSEAKPDPEVETVPVASLAVDPQRFQYKASSNSDTGVTTDLRAKGWNKHQAGVIAVWTDPADGKTYVVNGHHRFDLARRTGQPTVNVLHLEADDAQHARLMGAHINIGEGRGTDVDAAKVFRDSKMTQEQLADANLPMGEAKVRNGLTLAGLDDTLFQLVTMGQVPVGDALAIGENLKNHAQQFALWKQIDEARQKGRTVTQATIREMARDVGEAGTAQVEQTDLFGTHSREESLAFERAEVKAYIRERLSKEKRAFGGASKDSTAEILESAGNKIDVGANRARAQSVDEKLALFDKLSSMAGSHQDVLRQAASRLRSREGTPESIKRAAYDDFLAALGREAGQADASGEGGAEGDRSGPTDEGPSLFDAPAEAEAIPPSDADAGVEGEEPKFSPKLGGVAGTAISEADMAQMRQEAAKAAGIRPEDVLFLPEIRVSASDPGAQKALAAHGMSGDAELRGRYLNGVIQVSLAQSQPEAIRANRHEIGHAVLDTIKASSPALHGQIIEDLGMLAPRTGTETKPQRHARLGEVFSDKLAEWWEGEGAQPRPALKRAFEMARKMLDSIGDFLRKRGFKNASDVFGAAEGAASRRLSKTFRGATEGRFARGPRGTTDAAMVAYHGSPHDFDKFDSSKIGTGEGAQAFGHGLYFAGDEGIAQYYRDRLSETKKAAFSLDGAPPVHAAAFDLEIVKLGGIGFSAARDAVRALINAEGDAALASESLEERAKDQEQWAANNPNSPDVQDAAEEATHYRAASRALARLAGRVKMTTVGGGKLYKVDLKPADDEWLDWDKKIGEQGDSIKAAIKRLNDADLGIDLPVFDDEDTGQGVVLTLNHELGNDAQASRALYDAGIPGVRYLDGNSRIPGRGKLNARWGAGGKAEVFSVQTGAVLKTFDTFKEADAWIEENAGKPNHNFVVFDDSLVDIQEKYQPKKPPVETEGGPRPRSLMNKLGGVVRRNLTSKGDLPQVVFDAKVSREARFNAIMRDIAYAERDLRAAIKKTYGKSWEKLTDTEKQQLDQEYKGEPTNVSGPVLDALHRMREQTDLLSRRMVDEGVVDGPLADVFEDNQGVYARRSYRVFDDPKWAEHVDPAIRAKAKAWLRAENPDLSEGEVEGLIEKLLHRKEDGPIAFLARGSKLGAKDLSMLVRRKDIAPEIRALMGEYEDPLMNYARSVAGMAQALTNHQFLTEVREAGLGEFLHEKPIVKDGVSYHKEIASSGSKVLEPLNGLHTTEEIERAFRDAFDQRQVGELIRAYMKANGALKYGKTILSPTTQARNLVSNVGFAIANGHWRVGTMGDAAKAVLSNIGAMSSKEWRAEYRRLVELGVVHESPRAGELKDVERDALTADQMKSKLAAPLKVAEAMYGAEDDVWKLFAYYNEVARYKKARPDAPLSEIHDRAAEIVRATYPTYSMIPKAVRALKRIPLIAPFPSWTAEVIRTAHNTVALTAKELRDPNPGVRAIGAQRLAGTLVAAGLIGAITASSRFLNGVTKDDDKDARRFMPEWSQNSSIAWLSRGDDGKLRYLDASYQDPHSYFRRPVIAMLRGEDIKKSIVEAAQEAGRPFLSPEILATAIQEAYANKTDSGRAVYNKQDDLLSRTEDIAGHIGKAALPGFAGTARRIYKAAKGEQEESGRSYDLSDELLAAVTGFRMQEVDVPQSMSFRAGAYSRDMSEAMRILSSVASRRGKVSESELKEAQESTETARRKLFVAMHADIMAAMRLGVPRTQIVSILTSNGTTQNNAERLINNEYLPYKPTSRYLESAEDRADSMGEDAGVYAERRKLLGAEDKKSGKSERPHPPQRPSFHPPHP